MPIKGIVFISVLFKSSHNSIQRLYILNFNTPFSSALLPLVNFEQIGALPATVKFQRCAVHQPLMALHMTAEKIKGIMLFGLQLFGGQSEGNYYTTT